MWVRHSYRLISKQIFIEKCSWDTKWMNKWDSHKVQAQVFIKHFHTKMGWVKNIKKSRSCSQEMARGATLKGHHEAPHPSAQSIRSDSVGTVSLLHMNLLPLSFWQEGKICCFFFQYRSIFPYAPEGEYYLIPKITVQKSICTSSSQVKGTKN